MTDVLITIDTELSASRHQLGLTVAQNIASSIEGRVGAGRYGIGWQMDEMEACGLKGVFFVDPLPALVYGPDILPGIVAPILARGHEVQLHIHTEWLQWAKASPVGERQGRNIADFSEDDQRVLLGTAVDLLVEAGVPRPTAFRAGNFGVDNRTLNALGTLGLTWDSSVNRGCPGGQPIVLPADQGYAPFRIGDIIELPVSGLFDRPGHFRPAQVCALSSWEMAAALRHAAAGSNPFVIVTHSFEMLSRDRRRPNRTVIDRFRRMCAAIARTPPLRSVGFNDLDPASVEAGQTATLLQPNAVRTWGRLAEQTVSTLLYERRAA